MKGLSTIAFFATTALAATAPYTFNNDTSSSFTCTEKYLVAYCLGGDIILRCANGTGYAGNCNDNLAGEPPLGDGTGATCYAPSRYSPDAACAKGGLVYPSSGSGNCTDSGAAPYPIPKKQNGGNSTTTCTTTTMTTTTAPCSSTVMPTSSNGTLTYSPPLTRSSISSASSTTSGYTGPTFTGLAAKHTAGPLLGMAALAFMVL